MRYPLLFTLLSLTVGDGFSQAPEPVDVKVENHSDGTCSVEWDTVNNHTYFMQVSPDLTKDSWRFLPIIESGDGLVRRYGLQDPSGRGFFRLRYTNQLVVGPVGEFDFDGDGYGSMDELTILNTDPLNADSNGDGTLDGQEDTDNDGVEDGYERLISAASGADNYTGLRSVSLANAGTAGRLTGQGGLRGTGDGDTSEDLPPINVWTEERTISTGGDPNENNQEGAAGGQGIPDTFIESFSVTGGSNDFVSLASEYYAREFPIVEEEVASDRWMASRDINTENVTIGSLSSDVYSASYVFVGSKSQIRLVVDRELTEEEESITQNFLKLRYKHRTREYEFLEVVKLEIPIGSEYSEPYELKEEPDGSGGREVLLPIEIIIPKQDSNGNIVKGEFVKATELKVAKWENAFTGNAANGAVRPDFISYDKDQFWVRIIGANNLGITSVEIATEDNLVPEYNDDATEMEFVGNTGLTKSMILVSDDVDDDYPDSGAGTDDQKNDRTHKIQLGGNLVIKSVTINGEKKALDVKIPVRVKGELDLDLNNMNVPFGFAKSDIQKVGERMKEYYAQVGLEINFNVNSMEWPAQVEVAKGLEGDDRAPGYFFAYKVDDNRLRYLSNSYKAFIDHTDTSGVNLFYLSAAFPSAGVTISLKSELARPRSPLQTEIDFKYLANAIVNRAFSGPKPNETSAHELLHILGPNPVFGSNDHAQPFYNLLAESSGKTGVLNRKRISHEQEHEIYTYPLIRKIN